ncbi:hypothetical protein KCG55_02900 [Neisseria subflava]|uniref:hypothetical protein n=1 Tax=Neisseria subflava TaxID=28449 RepID=UPI0020B87E3D|nr:hypothetical protein [Neisseria subflava]UTG74960.1 hypothetical protein KCG55_02900 [Neisseria subflava]
MSYPQQAIDNILKQRRQPVNKRKTKNRQARAARPAVSVRRAKPLEKLSEKLFAISMVTAFAALVPLFSLIAEIVRAVMGNGFSDGLRPLQNSFPSNSRNPNTGFRLFSPPITPDFTQIPPFFSPDTP